jgi:hypothetical protein
MKLVFFIVFFLGCFFFLFFFIKFLHAFNVFTDYLFEIDDKDTLRKIGRLNSLGQRVLYSVPFTKVHKTLKEKYEESNNEKYFEFYKKYLSFSNALVFLSIFLFMTYIIYKILYYS